MSEHASQPEHDPEAGEPVEAHGTTTDLNVGLIVTIGIVSVLLLFVAVFGTQAWFRFEVQQERQRKVVDQPRPAAMRSLDEQAQFQLEGPPQWTSKEQGLASVPIGTAIEGYVGWQQRGEPALPEAEAGSPGTAPAPAGTQPAATQ